jgi:hypothetical protein
MGEGYDRFLCEGKKAKGLVSLVLYKHVYVICCRIFADPPASDGAADFVLLYGRPTVHGGEPLSNLSRPLLQIGIVTFSRPGTFRIDIYRPEKLDRSFSLGPPAVVSLAASLPRPGTTASPSKGRRASGGSKHRRVMLFSCRRCVPSYGTHPLRHSGRQRQVSDDHRWSGWRSGSRCGDRRGRLLLRQAQKTRG